MTLTGAVLLRKSVISTAERVFREAHRSIKPAVLPDSV
jgi:hypothetical protein